MLGRRGPASNASDVDERARRLEAKFEWPMLAAAVLVIPAIVIESSDPSEPWSTVAVVLNWITWLAFATELVVMLVVVPSRWRWIRDHPLEVAVVILTPPFLPAALQAARVFRLLRLLRLVAAAKLVRRLLSLEGVRDAAVLALLVVLGGGAAFAAVETPEGGGTYTAWDGIWWAITTVTTVGYGDVAPTTDGGRAIAVAVMVVGIGFIALLTAAAAERFIRSEASRERDERLASIDHRLDRIEHELARPPAGGTRRPG